jgi:hypothetical protein
LKAVSSTSSLMFCYQRGHLSRTHGPSPSPRAFKKFYKGHWHLGTSASAFSRKHGPHLSSLLDASCPLSVASPSTAVPDLLTPPRASGHQHGEHQQTSSCLTSSSKLLLLRLSVSSMHAPRSTRAVTATTPGSWARRRGGARAIVAQPVIRLRVLLSPL